MFTLRDSVASSCIGVMDSKYHVKFSRIKNFFKIQFPLITPGVISGALIAFIASFDEVVIVLFIGGQNQITLPRQMWSGIRQEISPTILSVATILVILSILLLTAVELLRRRNDKLRGLK